MSFLNSFIFIVSISAFLSCGNRHDEVAKLKKENARLQHESDSLKNLKLHDDSITVEVKGRPQPEEVGRDTARGLQGKHDFTLQWISWTEPGSVTILPAKDGWYSIKGGQKSRQNTDYITINGLIRQISATELLFKGEIKSVIASNNNGEPCIKTGDNIFKTTRNRKYWRLQDMINCEGGLLTDYVDIYF